MQRHERDAVGVRVLGVGVGQQRHVLQEAAERALLPGALGELGDGVDEFLHVFPAHEPFRRIFLTKVLQDVRLLDQRPRHLICRVAGGFRGVFGDQKTETHHGVLCPRREPDLLDTFDGLPGSQHLALRVVEDHLLRLQPDTARGIVDHPAQARYVVGIDEQAQVGQRVFDLLTLIERHAGDDAVRNAAPAQRFFERATLGVGAVEDGEVAVRIALPQVQVANGAFGLLRLVFLREGLHQDDVVALMVVRPEFFFELIFVVLDDRIGEAEDVFGRAIILLQTHDGGLGIVALKREDVADVGSAKGVDALRVVAHDTDVFMLRREHLGQGILGAVGILVFVDVEVRPTLLVFLQDLRFLLEEFDGMEQEVVEVDGVGAAEGLLIGSVEERGFFLRQRSGHAGVGFGRDHLVFGAGDERPQRPHSELLRVDVVAFHQRAQQAFGVVGVVDREIAGEAEVVAFDA